MSDVFDFLGGDSPLLISVPHDGREIPDDIRARMTDSGLNIPDTDWHVRRLYDFAAGMGASLLQANYSRYVVDLNRSKDDGVLYPGQIVTGLCPEKTFAGEPIYRDGAISAKEIQARVDRYWRPYHEKIRTTLQALREKHGVALLWDAHSIPSVVPRLFDGELPVLSLGSNDGASCNPAVERDVADIAAGSPYESVLNGRFKGGFITRHYGQPTVNVHALQLEIAQRAYMDEGNNEYDAAKANRLRDTLRVMLQTYLETADA